MAKRKSRSAKNVGAASYWAENFPAQIQQMVQTARESGNPGEVFRNYFTSPEFINQFRNKK